MNASSPPHSSPATQRDRVALAPPPHPCPPGFFEHRFESSFRIAAERAAVWSWLEDPRTFIDGQIWPFRVEFLSTEAGVEPGFHIGGVNIHHGPLMSLAGQLTEIEEGSYRALHYFYGSYVLTLRLIRPTALEFWIEPADEGVTHVRLRLTSYVRGWFEGVWTTGQGFFWGRFPRFMASGLRTTVVE